MAKSLAMALKAKSLALALKAWSLLTSLLTATRIAGFKLLRHPSYLADFTPTDFLFQNWKKITKRWKFTDDNNVICTASGSLEDQDQEFFYNGITGYGESLDQVHFCRRGLCWKATIYHANILLLTVPGYKLFERPSYWHQTDHAIPKLLMFYNIWLNCQIFPVYSMLDIVRDNIQRQQQTSGIQKHNKGKKPPRTAPAASWYRLNDW